MRPTYPTPCVAVAVFSIGGRTGVGSRFSRHVPQLSCRIVFLLALDVEAVASAGDGAVGIDRAGAGDGVEQGAGDGGCGLVGEGGDFVADAVLVFAGERGQALTQEVPFGGGELG